MKEFHRTCFFVPYSLF